MDKRYDVAIHISPSIGEYNNNNVFLRPLNRDEFKVLEDCISVNYNKKNISYQECIFDLKDKLKKIKTILEE